MEKPSDGLPAQTRRVGGRLSFFQGVWATKGRNAWVLKTVSEGHRWTFLEAVPHRFTTTRRPAGTQESQVLSEYVESLLREGAITPVPLEERFTGVYSPLFLVPKSSGDWRPVIDLRYLNGYIKKEHFKMESLQSILQVIQPGDWMLSIDLRDAYLHVPVHQECQRFLRFTLQHRHFQFTSLPFGLTTSPRTFSKILVVTIAYLREKGIRVHHYLDDVLLLAGDRESLVRHREIVLQTLADFGWLVNWKKSQLDPTQQLVYLGAFLDTGMNTVSLPEEKAGLIRQRLRGIGARTSMSARQCLSWLGTMTSAVPMVKWARWNSRKFQKGFLRQWSAGSMTQEIQILTEMRRDLSWWYQRENLSSPHSLIPPLWILVTSDASEVGWGATCQSRMAQGTWRVRESGVVSNILELRAAHQALLAFKDILKGREVLLQMDNVAAVAYVRKQGGTRSRTLLKEVEPIMHWAQHNVSLLSAQYLPGQLNQQADYLSRVGLDNNEWALNPRVFREIVPEGFQPQVDLFAAEGNAKLPSFYTRYPCQGAMASDALLAPWPFKRAYAFPPIPLVGKFLRRLLTEKASVLAVIPHWPRRPWFPLLLQLSVEEPRALPERRDLLSQGPILHPNPGKLRLWAWRLKGRG